MPMTEDDFGHLVEGWVRARAREGARVIGVSGPQGCGKSTLCGRLVRRLAEPGAEGGALCAVALSVDDVYLTFAEQSAVAAAHPGNRALEFRGYPGTHDVALGTSLLDALVAGAVPLSLPVYDKGAHGGRGDRASDAAFRRVERAPDVVLFEGWMLAFSPVLDGTDRDLGALAAPNEALRGYSAWRERINAWVVLEASDLSSIVEWRVDAERARRRLGLGGLGDNEARDYIERFLQGYRLWSPGARLGRELAGPRLHVTLGADRGATEVRELRRGS